MKPIPKWIFREHNGKMSQFFWPEVDYHREARQEVKWIVRTAQVKLGDKALDLACGNGRHAVILARHGITTTGVDCCPHQIRLGRMHIY